MLNDGNKADGQGNNEKNETKGSEWSDGDWETCMEEENVLRQSQRTWEQYKMKI